MGLLLTLDDIVGEEVARVGAEEGAAAACSDTSAGKLRVFDLHCDTLDRLAFHGDPTVPGGFAAHDARDPGRAAWPRSPTTTRTSRSRARPASPGASASRRSSPTQVRGDAAWALFERVHGVLAARAGPLPDKLAQARTHGRGRRGARRGRDRGPCSPWRARRSWRTTAAAESAPRRARGGGRAHGHAHVERAQRARQRQRHGRRADRASAASLRARAGAARASSWTCRT